MSVDALLKVGVLVLLFVFGTRSFQVRSHRWGEAIVPRGHFCLFDGPPRTTSGCAVLRACRSAQPSRSDWPGCKRGDFFITSMLRVVSRTSLRLSRAIPSLRQDQNAQPARDALRQPAPRALRPAHATARGARGARACVWHPPRVVPRARGAAARLYPGSVQSADLPCHSPECRRPGGLQLIVGKGREIGSSRRCPRRAVT